jgi:meiotic recombination protein REC8, fungi type
VWLVIKQSFNYIVTNLYRLVATLGSKSALRKVTRKAILDVDVPKACGTIQDPSAPMALRLQGNLLYVSPRTF